MTGELELRGGGTDLTSWADEARKIHAIALSLAGTSFVPRSMQGRPDEVTGAILAGRELGLEPMAALRAIDIIDGTPALRAVALRGLVQAHGHQVWVDESTETRAVVRGRRRGEPNVQTSIWTAERARKAGLSGKKNWTAHPQAMLVARATAEICRLVASDVLIALPHVAEELGDDVETAVVETPTVGKRRTAQRKPLTAVPFSAVGSGPLTTGPSVDEVAEPAPAELSDGFLAALMAGYREIGIYDREKRLTHTSRIIGRPITSASDLTQEEAHTLLASIEAEAARREDGMPAQREPDQ